MAIAGTPLTGSGTLTPSTSQATASISPTSNRLVLATVLAGNGGGTAPPQPTLSGNGLTWVAVLSFTFTDGATETFRMTLFRAMGASPSTGAITIAHSSAPNSFIAWTIREYPDVLTTGANGADAVRNPVSAAGTGTAVSRAMAAYSDATNNGADLSVGALTTPTISPEAGGVWTAYAQQTFFSSLRAMWRLGEDTTATATLSASARWGAIAVELVAAPSGGTVYELVCSPGSVSIAGTNAGLNAQRLLTAQPGSVALAGTNAALNASRLLTAQPGSVAITGTQAGLRATRLLLAEPGAVSITGTQATLLASRLLTAQPGSVLVAGTDADLRAARVLVAQAGSVTILGTDAALLAHRLLTAQPGAIVLAGTDATLTYVTGGTVFTLTCSPGSVTIAGTDVALLVARLLTAQPGAVAIAGTDAGLHARRVLTAQPGSVVLTGAAVQLLAHRLLTAQAGAVLITGTDAGLTYSAFVEAGPGVHPLTLEFADLAKTLEFAPLTKDLAFAEFLKTFDLET